MDISDLLSSDTTPVRPLARNSAQSASLPRRGRAPGRERTSSSLSYEIKHSPDRNASPPPSRNASSREAQNSSQAKPFSPAALNRLTEAAPNFRPLHSSASTIHPAIPATDPSNVYTNYAQRQLQQRPSLLTQRHLSTPETVKSSLLPSTQHQHLSTRTYSASHLQHTDVARTSRSPSLIHPVSSPPPVRTPSGQSLADLTMAEAPAQTPPPRHITSAALSEADSRTVTKLLSYLAENSYAYDSHVQLISVLHKGFLSHLHPTDVDSQAVPPNPQSYGLLKELRQAREAMDSRFAVGEALWLDWLADETILATSGEERVSVTELHQKAVQDEPASVKLWGAYADWVQSNYESCHDIEGATQSGWSEIDKEMCRELFTKDMLLDVLEQGVSATKWCIQDSHLLWNRLAELLVKDLGSSPTTHDMERVRELFLARLQTPHATSNETAQMFWPIINRYQPDQWESIMALASEAAEPARRQVALREEHELAVRRSLDAGDRDTLLGAWTAYLQWERKHIGRGPFAKELCLATFERALLNFPTYTDWWQDYTNLVISSHPTDSALPLLERATRHCPWSGDLWATRILRADVEGKPHVEIEATKHRATNSGLLDLGGMEELLKVLQQWCSYLRRHAFKGHSTEDDLDTAEVGITMALEDIQQAGRTIYGEDFKGDPLYRLEAIQIKFLSEARRFDDARAIYQRLSALHKNSYDFWMKYYSWELWQWGWARMQELHRVETSDNGPDRATAVLQQALAQRYIDSPEKILRLYLDHFQQHESGEKLQAALIEAREYSRHLSARRLKEVESAAEQQQQEQPAAAASVHSATLGDKRKAEDHYNKGEHKKTKIDNAAATDISDGEPSPSQPAAQGKRDREHNMITVRSLPPNVQELDLKKFFRDIGQPLSINIVRNHDGTTSTATVEFETHEDVLAAKTRNGKELGGFQVHIQSGSLNTLYVANYPPEYDENAIRKLFDSYGEIISVRFPSLKFNNRRRFCYVQFLTDEMARAAEEAMNDKSLDGQHRLIAKISNPDAKKQRSGAQAEGRELFVKNIERTASEEEVKQFFRQYGEVVSMNLLKLVNNKRTGSGFIVFASADAANAALAADKRPFKDRILHVELSSPKAEGRVAPLERARKTDIIVHAAAASMSPEPDAVGNGRRASDVSMQSASQPNEETFRTARERKIAVFNLPDTVNDARVRAAMEKYGPLVKIQLRRQDNGAIVEFVNIQDAFNVRAGVDVSSLGAEVRTGDVADLLSKVRKRQATSDATEAAASFTVGLKPPMLSRPGQRPGRRGGLGYKRGGSHLGDKATAEAEGHSASHSDNGKAAPKSNADFRTMLAQRTAIRPVQKDEQRTSANQETSV